MTAQAALSRLRTDGFTLEVDQSGRLLVRPADRLTPTHRDLINAYRRALVALLLSPPTSADHNTDTRLWRRWLIRLADGQAFESHFAPPATRAEVCAWYPDAQSIDYMP